MIFFVLLQLFVYVYQSALSEIGSYFCRCYFLGSYSQIPYYSLNVRDEHLCLFFTCKTLGSVYRIGLPANECTHDGVCLNFFFFVVHIVCLCK